MKMLYSTRRPRYKGAQDIGSWYVVFQVLTYCAVVTNCAILGITSRVLTEGYGLTSAQAVGFVVILEHCLLILKVRCTCMPVT